jgi:beta-carotene hydroxylase
MKPLLDEKGSPQTLGILEGKKDFWGFLYDVFLGIRFHHKSSHEN